MAGIPRSPQPIAYCRTNPTPQLLHCPSIATSRHLRLPAHRQFEPGKICAGDYEFAIGTAGSCTLVLQTVLPALLFADAPSRVRLSGGTHNSMAPPVHFCSAPTAACWKQWARAWRFA
ncbi:MAG: RNA 3'-terminal phosphate cyclase [Duganella sp.]